MEIVRPAPHERPASPEQVGAGIRRLGLIALTLVRERRLHDGARRTGALRRPVAERRAETRAGGLRYRDPTSGARGCACRPERPGLRDGNTRSPSTDTPAPPGTPQAPGATAAPGARFPPSCARPGSSRRRTRGPPRPIVARLASPGRTAHSTIASNASLMPIPALDRRTFSSAVATSPCGSASRGVAFRFTFGNAADRISPAGLSGRYPLRYRPPHDEPDALPDAPCLVQRRPNRLQHGEQVAGSDGVHPPVPDAGQHITLHGGSPPRFYRVGVFPAGPPQRDHGVERSGKRGGAGMRRRLDGSPPARAVRRFSSARRRASLSGTSRTLPRPSSRGTPPTAMRCTQDLPPSTAGWRDDQIQAVAVAVSASLGSGPDACDESGIEAGCVHLRSPS